MSSLLAFRKNYHSQNGEDGMIEELLHRLHIKSGWYVDIGAWDGKHLSNVFFLLERGWHGVGIEADPAKVEDMKATAAQHNNRLTPILSNIKSTGSASLDSLLAATDIPHAYDILNIDIDSYDWWIWKNAVNYQPKIVVIEINSSIPPGIPYVQEADKQFDERQSNRKQGASFTSTLELGQAKGYTLVAHTGNMIFVSNDLAPQLNLPQQEIDNPNSLFNDTTLVKKWVTKESLLKASRLYLKEKVGNFTTPR